MEFEFDNNFLNSLSDNNKFQNDILNEINSELNDTMLQPIKKKPLFINRTKNNQKQKKINKSISNKSNSFTNKTKKETIKMEETKKPVRMSISQKEKNRLSAKRCRLRKKEYILSLRKTNIQLEQKIKYLEKIISNLQKKKMIKYLFIFKI